MSQRRAPGPSVFADPAALRVAVRRGEFRDTTAGLLPASSKRTSSSCRPAGPRSSSSSASRNPRPCPLLDVTAAGSPDPRRLAPGAGLRTDVPGYRVFAQGAFRETTDLHEGVGRGLRGLPACVLAHFERFQAVNIPLRHVSSKARPCRMYRTSLVIPTARLAGLIVGTDASPIPRALVERATEISARWSRVARRAGPCAGTRR